METLNAFQAMLRQVFRLTMIRFDAAERYPPVWRAVLGGAGLGLLWGIAARIWMRLISTRPEFSIPGTAAILVIATIFGACAGLAFAARQRGWQRWGHYAARGLAVIFFLPFGIAGGTPLMLTVLLATLGLTQPALIGLWALAALALLLRVGTDIGIPTIVVIIVPAGAIALTAWKLIARRWHSESWITNVDTWLDRIGRAILLLLAAAGFGFVAREVVTDKPGLLGPVYVLFYLILLYPLFLALRVGLEPRTPAGSAVNTIGTSMQPPDRRQFDRTIPIDGVQ
jgi:hypothetical protein